jgi:hypothetical protein
MQPGEDLVRILEVLRTRLNTSGVERTAGLRSAMGDDCTFYRKSLNILLNKDYEDLFGLVKEALREFEKIER